MSVWGSFFKSASKGEFAPGIPSSRSVQPLPSVSQPKTWEFGVHRHLAERAGEHYDLRLGDPDEGHAHSWAMRSGLPGPGEKRLAVQQPTHTIGYMDFKGPIEEGYGKGQVELAQRDRTEVLRSGPNEVRFNLYKGKENQEYSLRRMRGGSNWMIQNVTPSRSVGPAQNLPSSKPKYREVKDPFKLNTEDQNSDLQAKIDGAHVLFQFKGTGSTPRVFSYRPTERATGLIDHTQKLEGFSDFKTPPELAHTTLRGELYAVDDKGKALPAARVGGILNANVWKSREKQQQEGKLVPVVFDVARFKGRDVEGKPYAEKKEMLSKAVGAAPWLQQPRTASTPEEKRKLIEDISAGREPSTDEGVVEWRYDRAVPVKAKFKAERDVFVRSVFPEAGKRQGMAGGFEFSYSKDGPVVGRVGTGMSHEMKRDMLQNPSKYEGLQARVTMQRAPERYAPRAPAFKSFHLDQEIPEDVKTAAEIVKEAKITGGFYQGKPASPDTIKKTVDFQGMKIKVDRPKGFIMMGKDSKGVEWKRKYQVDYGFIPKTVGGDNDGLDVFIGPKSDSKKSFWAVQRKEDGSFDEYKVFLGYDNRDEAIACYRQHIPKKYFGRMISMTVDMMKAMLGKMPDEEMKPGEAKTASWNGFFRELNKLADSSYFGEGSGGPMYYEEGMDEPVDIPPQMIQALRPTPPPRREPLVPSIMDIRHPAHDHLRLALLGAAISKTIGPGSVT